MTAPTTPSLPPRVTIDSLRAGAQFTAADGAHCTYERSDGANSGAHHVRRADGTATLYAGCALVTLGWNERGWFADRDTYEGRSGVVGERDPFDSFASDF